MTWLITQIWLSLLFALAVGAIAGWLLKSWRFGPLRQVLADVRASQARQDTELTKLKRERDDVQMRIKRQESELQAARAQVQAATQEQAKLGLEVVQWQELARELESKLRMPNPLSVQSKEHGSEAAKGESSSAEQELARRGSELAQAQKQQAELQRKYDQALAAASVLEKHKAELARVIQEQDDRLKLWQEQARAHALEPEREEQRLLADLAKSDADRQRAEAHVARLELELAQLREHSAIVHVPGKEQSSRSGKMDDLKRIRGIGGKLEQQLHAMGITELSTIAQWTDEDIERVSAALGSFRKRVRADDWVGQARRLLG